MYQMPALMGKWVGPLQRTNQFVVQRVEQWTTLQMDSLKAYVDLGVAQCKVALKVTDPRGLHEFTDGQFAVLSFVGHRMLDDGWTLARWNSDSYRQADQVARRNLLDLLFG
ncbi:MAG: phasin family protein [Candidatus Contendobacter sp.]|nr:phasin family protein [Candidatus Contendobacter sp.]MDG4558304.1 phasin family protein [Candidatus Contendobacter sp.]